MRNYDPIMRTLCASGLFQSLFKYVSVLQDKMQKASALFSLQFI